MDRRIIVMVVAALFICGNVFAMCGSCGGEHESGKSAAVKVNNMICPVSGDKVSMENPTTVEYKGEAYNLCCSACIAEFNKDPEKYSAKAKGK